MATRAKKSAAQPVAEKVPKTPAAAEESGVKAAAKATVKPATKKVAVKAPAVSTVDKAAVKVAAKPADKKTAKVAGKKTKVADRAAGSESKASINPTSAWPFPIGPRPK